jgi:choline dehydrogenase-like flavoprotein
MTMPERAIRTFELVADTLIAPLGSPGPGRQVLPSELGMGRRLVDEIHSQLNPRAAEDLAQLLKVLDSGPGGFLLHGAPISFTGMKPEERVRAMERMSKHPFSKPRLGFKTLKTLAGLLWSNPPPGDPSWEPWQGMGYPGPDGAAPAVPKPLTPLPIADDTTLDCDVVIVGSGAGGGVAAAVLAAAGLGVVVLEKGEYRNEADFTHHEPEALSDLYLDGGLGTTSDGGIGILAGSTLGGGTVVNYTTSFAPPGDVTAEWDRVSGFDGVFTGDEFARSVSTVSQRIGVNTENGEPSQREVLLEKGLRHLGWHVEEQPRNAVGCTPQACGYCGMGCRLGAKQSTLRTWLEDAAAADAVIVTGADVDTVTRDKGRANGVVAKVGRHTLRVRARAVVLAAGALHTPAIMQRSGIRGSALGANLRLHPVTAVWGRFEDPVEPWTGILQARWSGEFADPDGDGYGYRFETAPVHPTFPSAFFGWDDGARFREDLLSLAHSSPIGILLRDSGAGKVKTRASGDAVWDYRISDTDKRRMRDGVRHAAEVLAAAGAQEVLASTIRPVRWRPGNEGSLDEFVAATDSVGYGANQTSYLSFHQMGSARMGSTKKNSVVGPENEAHTVPGLYVMDGSAFPTPSGVNPMITIEAIAHRAARALAAKLA